MPLNPIMFGCLADKVKLSAVFGALCAQNSFDSASEAKHKFIESGTEVPAPFNNLPLAWQWWNLCYWLLLATYQRCRDRFCHMSLSGEHGWVGLGIHLPWRVAAMECCQALVKSSCEYSVPSITLSDIYGFFRLPKYVYHINRLASRITGQQLILQFRSLS